MSNEVKYEIRDDKIIKMTPLVDIAPDVYKIEDVIDKETFIAAYKKWILGEETEETNEGS